MGVRVFSCTLFEQKSTSRFCGKQKHLNPYLNVDHFRSRQMSFPCWHKSFGNKIVVSPIRSTCVSVCLPGRKVVFHLFNRMWGGGPATLFLYWKQCWWKRSIFCNYDHARVYHYNYLVFYNSGLPLPQLETLANNIWTFVYVQSKPSSLYND